MTILGKMMNYGISECANFQTQQHEILDGLPLPSILIPNVAGNVHQFSLKSPDGWKSPHELSNANLIADDCF